MKHNNSSVQGSSFASCATFAGLALVVLFVLAAVLGKGLSFGMGI